MTGVETQNVQSVLTVKNISKFYNGFFKILTVPFSITFLLFVLSVFVNAQTDQSNVRFTEGNFNDSGSLNLGVPLGSYSGRGLNLPVSLNYSSDVWRIEHAGTVQMTVPPYNMCCLTVGVAKAIYSKNTTSGWRTSLALPIIEYPKNNAVYDYQGKSSKIGAVGCNYRVREVYIHMPDGASHTLRKDDVPTTGAVDKSSTFYAVDGSRMRFVGNGTDNTGTLYMPDGTVYSIGASVSTITDRNGNSMSYNNSTRQWTDTLGRVISNPIPATPTVGDFSYTLPGLVGVNNGLINYTFKWRTLENALTPQNGSTPAMRVVGSEYLPTPSGAPSSSNVPTQESSSLEPLFKSTPGGYGKNGWQYGTQMVGDEQFPVANGGQLFNPVVLTEIVLPDGTSYKFSYNVYGEMDKVIYPTNAYDQYEYNGPAAATYPDEGEGGDPQPYIQSLRSLKSRKLSADGSGSDIREWKYTVIRGLDGGGSTTVINPDKTRVVTELYGPGNQTATYGGPGGQTITMVYPFGFKDARVGMPKFKKFYSSSSDGLGGDLVKHDVYEYQQTTGATISTSCVIGQSTQTRYFNLKRTPRLTRMTSIVFEGSGSALAQSSTYDYDFSYEYSTGIDQTLSANYNYVVVSNAVGQSGDLTQIPLGTLHSYTETIHSTDTDYRNSNILGLAISSQTKDINGTVVSRIEMLYDESAYSTGFKRGLPTTSRTWDSTKGLSTNANAYLVTHATFDTYGNRTITSDAMGNQTTTVYDSTYHAFPISTTTAVPDPTGTKGSTVAFTTSTSYDSSTPPLGLPMSTTDANGQMTTLSYVDPVTGIGDPLLRVRKVTAPNGQQTITEYGLGTTEATRYVKVKTQIDGTNWSQTYNWQDGIGRTYKTQKVDSEGDVFALTCYDSVGRVQKNSNPFRNVANANCSSSLEWTTPAYDTLGRVISTTLPDSSTVQIAYGLSTSGVIGVTKQITDQAGKKRKGITDAMGRMVRVIEDPDNSNLATDYVFDTLGNLRKTVQGEQTRYFSYDSIGRLLYAKQSEQEANTNFVFTDSITNNSAWSVKYEYDDNSNITKTTNASGVYVQGTYDKLNRLTQRDYSDATPDVDFYYDGTGLSAVPAYSKGKATKVSSTVSETRYTSFDIMGRLLSSEQRTPFSDSETPQTATPRVSSYQYNLSGTLVKQTYPSLRTVSYDYDSDGDAASVWGTAGTQNRLYANSIRYNASGAVERLRLGNGKWESAKYNSRLQVTEIGLGNGTTDTSLLKLEYGYGTSAQNNGSMRSQKIGFSGLAQAFEQTYTYDNLNRIQDAKEMVGTTETWKQTFSYDRYGNRQFNAANTTTFPQNVPGKVTNPQINTSDNRFKKDQDNDTVTDYDYDKNGNLTLDAENQRFVYDAENHLKEFFVSTNNTSTPNAVYQYDGENRRVKKISATEITVFVYDGTGKLVAEYSTAISQTPQVSYLTADHLGTPRVITDQNGKITTRKDYTAFGSETYTAQRTIALGYDGQSETRKGYTGYEKDSETNLDYAQARYYNSAHGRFTSVDPLTASAAIKNPQTFNRYSYVLNSPYKFTDPLGLIPMSDASQGWNMASGGFWGSDFGGNSSHFGGPAIINESLARFDRGNYDQQQANRANSLFKKGRTAEAQAILDNNENLELEPQTPQQDDDGTVTASASIDSPLATDANGYTYIIGTETGLYNCMALGFAVTSSWLQPDQDSGETLSEFAVRNGATPWRLGERIPRGFTLMKIFEDSGNPDNWHVMRRMGRGDWWSKNGGTPLYINIENPDKFYRDQYQPKGTVTMRFFLVPIRPVSIPRNVNSTLRF